MNSIMLLGILSINLCWVTILFDYSFYHMLTLHALTEAIQEEYLFEIGRLYAQAYYDCIQHGTIQTIDRRLSPIDGVCVALQNKETYLAYDVTVHNRCKHYKINQAS